MTDQQKPVKVVQLETLAHASWRPRLIVVLDDGRLLMAAIDDLVWQDITPTEADLQKD